MLVLTRKVGESVRIGDDISLTIVRIRGDQIRFRINTPSDVANSVAQVHCRTLGKNAELIAYDQDGSAQIGRYRCR